MRWLAQMLGLQRRHRPHASPEAEATVQAVQEDWIKVKKIADRNAALYTKNGFIDAVTRAQGR